MKIAAFLLHSFYLFYTGMSYNILGLFPLPIRSHMAMYEKIMLTLAEKGHNVDVVSPYPQNQSIRGYNDIIIDGLMNNYLKNYSMSEIKELKSHYKFHTLILRNYGIDMCRLLLNSTAIKNLRDTEKKYDLVINGVIGAHCLLGFGYHFKIPVIEIFSSVAFPGLEDRIGNPDNPSYIPNYFSPYTSKMTFLERVFNTIQVLEVKLRHNLYNSLSTEIAREFFGPHLPDVRELASNTSLILVNSHFSINTARPTVPNFIEVAGLHISSPKPLSKHLEKVVDVQAKYKGVIYFSMGSQVSSEIFSLDTLKAFLYTFKKLPYQVLWKGERKRLPNDLDIPSNVHFEPWTPQIDVLCHPNVKLFITHGGLMSMQESIYCGVPLLGIPFFADQSTNLMISQANGLAILIEYDDITKENILNASTTLLENPKYANNLKAVSLAFRDRPVSALDTSVYWIQYVIRHKGAHHLRTIGADLSWYQYFLIDVMTVLLLISILFLCFFYYSCKVILIKFNVSSKTKTE